MYIYIYIYISLSLSIYIYIYIDSALPRLDETERFRRHAQGRTALGHPAKTAREPAV